MVFDVDSRFVRVTEIDIDQVTHLEYPRANIGVIQDDEYTTIQVNDVTLRVSAQDAELRVKGPDGFPVTLFDGTIRRVGGGQ